MNTEAKTESTERAAQPLRERVTASARLIAACRPMLAALRLMLQAHGTDPRTPDGYCRCGGCEAGRLAIAQVEGRAQ